MGVRVVAAPNRRVRWTPEAVAKMEELFESGYSPAVVAKRLGRSVDAIVVRRKREGVPSVTQATLNSRKVAQMLGISCSKSVVIWVERGLLKGRQSMRRGAHRQWVFREEDVLEFMKDPRGWASWEPKNIADKGLREWAAELRNDRLLTLGEVSRRYFVESSTVYEWIRDGHLPAVRHGNHRVLESSLKGFVPPHQRSKKGIRPQRYTPAEDAQILLMRRDGASWHAMAEQLGRSFGSVAGRYERLQAAAS